MHTWKYFTLEELTKSETAERLGYINNPLEEEKNNLNELVTNVLDPLREAWGKPIRVTSGYRCPRLNEIVGGVKNSQHKFGQAADIQPLDYSLMEEFKEFVRDWCESKEFDQCIIESNSYVEWIHISYRKGNNKKEIFDIRNEQDGTDKQADTQE